MSLHRRSLRSYPMMPVVLVTFVIFFSFAVQRPFVPVFAEGELGASILEVGYIASAIGFTGILSAVPSGFLSDRVGRRLPVSFGASIWAAALLLIANSNRPSQVLMAYALAGVGTAIFDSALSASVADVSRTDRYGRSYATYYATVQMGMAAGPAAGGLVALMFSYRRTFTVAALFAALAAAIALATLPGRDRGGDGHPSNLGFRTLGAVRPLWMGWLTVFSASTIIAGVGTILPLYAASEGFDELLIGLIFTVQAAASISARIPFGPLIDRIPRTAPIILASILVASTATASLTLYPQYLWLIVVMAASGLGTSLAITSASVAIVRHTDIRNRGLAMGYTSMSRFTGFTIGPILAATIASSQSDPSSGYLLAFIAIGAAALIGLIFALSLGWGTEGRGGGGK